MIRIDSSHNSRHLDKYKVDYSLCPRPKTICFQLEEAWEWDYGVLLVSDFLL